MQQAVIQQKAAQELAGQKALQAKMYQVLQEDNASVQDVVTLDDLIASLDQSSQAWPLIIDAQAKQLVVARYIQRFEERGVHIGKSALYYAYLIDDLSQKAPPMLEQPFENILQIVAIIEYDFDNGQDKDAMARRLLGEEEFRRNKQRVLEGR